MAARNLSEYIAGRTIRTVMERVGGKATFRYQAFEMVPGDGSSFHSWNNFDVEVSDAGRFIDFVVRRRQGEMEDLFLRIHPDLKGRDKEVVGKVVVYGDSPDQVLIRAEMARASNSSGRMQNENRLYNSLYRSTIKPILIATAQIGVK